MRRPKRRAAIRGATVAAGLAAASGGMLLSFTGQDRFPHEKHAGLFPTCVGCHAGIAAGDTAAFVSIAPEDCAGCHDGVEIRRVDWAGPERRASNLAFPHPTHVTDLEMDCTACHNLPDAPVRMAVQRATVGACLECHAPDAEGHLDLAAIECSTCHLPLVQAASLPSDRIANFPRPANHDQPDFLLIHGPTAEAEGGDCAVCHGRESCERCHLNADRLAPITALASDARIAELVAGRSGEWPEPASHKAADWATRHGEWAREAIEGCANCHAQESCEACHGEAGQPAVIARLPERRPGGPQGVILAVAAAGGARPVGHTADWIAAHGAAAALGTPNCATCHTERQCLECHDGAQRPGFHPVDFVVRHASEAYAAETECAACHSQEAFCRDCHEGAGLAAARSGSAAFHDAVPDWLIAHGLAARQDLEACTTCHQQDTCLRCHSAKAGLRVSPHGPDFDPDRVADRSTMSCAICHFDLPGSVEP
jgi:hypothetical protein